MALFVVVAGMSTAIKNCMKKQILATIFGLLSVTQVFAAEPQKQKCEFYEGKYLVEQFGEAYMTDTIPYEKALKMAQKNLADRLANYVANDKVRNIADPIRVVDDVKTAACLQVVKAEDKVSEARFNDGVSTLTEILEKNTQAYEAEPDSTGELINNFVSKNREAIVFVIEAYK